VRLLLLSRPRPRSPVGAALERLKEDAAGQLHVILDQARDLSGSVAELDAGHCETLYTAALDRFHRARQPDVPAPAYPPYRAGSASARPLDVLLDAFDTVLTTAAGADPPEALDAVPVAQPALRKALDHERKHWARRLPDLAPPVSAECMALGTLCGAATDTEVDVLLDLLATPPDEPVRSALRSGVAALYVGTSLWNPLQPDRLGEALIAATLYRGGETGNDAARIGRILAAATDVQAARALTVLSRVASEPSAASTLTTALRVTLPDLTVRCQPRPSDQRAYRARIALLDSLAVLASQLLTADLAARLPIDSQAQLGTSADALGGLAGDYGRTREARTLLSVALAAGEARLHADPDNPSYRRDVGLAHQRLGDLDRAAGQPGAARTHFQASLDSAQTLTDLDPDNPFYAATLRDAQGRLDAQ